MAINKSITYLSWTMKYIYMRLNFSTVIPFCRQQRSHNTFHIHLSRSKYLILCHCSPKFDWISLLLFIQTKLTSFDSKVTSYGRKSPKRFLLVVSQTKTLPIKFVSFFFSFFPPICCHFKRWSTMTWSAYTGHNFYQFSKLSRESKSKPTTKQIQQLSNIKNARKTNKNKKKSEQL